MWNVFNRLEAAGIDRPPLFALEAMGTRFELLLPGISDDRARPISEAVFDVVLQWHNALNAFSASSFVGRFNCARSGEWVRIDREIWAFLEYCRRVWKRSEGSFDPALGAPLRSWRQGAPPAAGETARGFQHVLWNDEDMAVGRSIAIELDFGSVAKGWAIDRATDLLRELGVREAFLHGGTSTASGIGVGPMGNGWHIQAVPDLHGPIIRLIDSAMSVSSPRGRSSADGSHHVIDPRTGASARCPRWAVCAAPSAADSDAWSTVGLVLGGAASPPEGVMIQLDSTDWV